MREAPCLVHTYDKSNHKRRKQQLREGAVGAAGKPQSQHALDRAKGGEAPPAARASADAAQKPQAAAVPRFPLFVDLTGADCLVVGAGAVGSRRAAVLARYGARVTVIDPAAPMCEGAAEVLARAYKPGDERGRTLVAAATNDRTVNHLIGEKCRAAGVPVSVADAPEECTFFFPAVCATEYLSAGVVSTGAKHTLAARAAAAVRQTLAACERAEV